MTLIVAFKCSDGIVVGADSAATLGSVGQETVKEIATKLFIVRGSLILGVSGPVGLAQRFFQELESMPAPEFQGLARKRAHDASTSISGLFWKHAQVEYQRAQVVAQAMGNRAALDNALHQTLVALRTGADDRLFQFTETCAPEEATDALPYVSIGSGQQNADPFLAFLRRVFWPGSVPSLHGGIFATLWTLTETIESCPGRVSGPITIAVLKDGAARFLEAVETEEHKEAVGEAQEALRGFRHDLEPDE